VVDDRRRRRHALGVEVMRRAVRALDAMVLDQRAAELREGIKLPVRGRAEACDGALAAAADGRHAVALRARASVEHRPQSIGDALDLGEVGLAVGEEIGLLRGQSGIGSPNAGGRSPRWRP